MPQIFHPSTNVISRVSVLGGGLIIAAAGGVLLMFGRSDYATEVNVVRSQPIEFSHRHHAGELGIDCRYCHTGVETSAIAGMPSTETCLTCHRSIWRNSPKLAAVHESARTGLPIRWTRVHDLPDFVYFDHSIHVARGMACEKCHGHVDDMPLMRRQHTLHMEWCLECHRHPPDNLVTATTHCSTCHR